MSKTAIIIGAGPAGLTAAYELLKGTDIKPVILEKSEHIGGISRTTQYKGNRMDMGPHRFFSKSDRVMDWWLNIMPLEANENNNQTIHYQNKSRQITPGNNGQQEKKMLLIQRLTRIYFLRKFFSYPIQLSFDTLRTLGIWRTLKIMLSYLWIKLFPRKPEKSLEDFIINKFGRQLYLLFFKDYTEKVWGVPCQNISAEWGAQRIKGVSLSKAIAQAVKTLCKKSPNDVGQKTTETSLIEQFLYPQYGPGSLWEEVARQIVEMGGTLHLNQNVQQIEMQEGLVTTVHTIDSTTGETHIWKGDYFFSSMPVQELVAAMGPSVPAEVQHVAEGLQYRDFINVGILLRQLTTPLKDNWIYIQEKDVRVGRLMIYNNWGGGMVGDPATTWIGMEYFCNKTDEIWALDDRAVQQLAIGELENLGLARAEDVLDSTVQRMEKTYPAYFGTYEQFDLIRAYTDGLANLFLVGRNGMHKYNNADHSMLTAMVAVDNIKAGITLKENVWAVNTEQEYHEEKKASPASPEGMPFYQPWWNRGLPGYVWSNSRRRAYLIGAMVLYIIQFIFFKIQYPFANYMPDSYSYLEAAYNNADVNMWPVAYSKFLRMMSVFSHSDKVLTLLQYLFMQAAGLLFLFTLLYFFSPGRIVRNVLLFFFLINPAPLYVANYISADALFTGLSLLWFTTLIWIICRPTNWQLAVQGVLLLACFTVRYNAIYYPLIGALVFLLSKRSWGWRLSGIAFGALLILGSITYTSHQMKEVTNSRQFSAFGGWQMANNALYMYQHIPASRRQAVPTRFASLENMVRQHMDTLSKVKFSHDDSANTFFYLWSSRSPLSYYLDQQYKKDSTTPYFKRWASEGVLYLDYARMLISRYPLSFFQYFMIPNASKFAVPPPEFLAVYNMGDDSVRVMAKDWFQYKSRAVQRPHHKWAYSPMEWYSTFSALVNVLFIIHVIGMLAFGSLKGQPGKIWKLFFISLFLWLTNMGFSVFASPIVLRYQVFPLFITFCAAMLLGDLIYRSTDKTIIA